MIALDYPKDANRVLNLCQRAQDYILLETGKGPNVDYVRETMTDAPAQVPADQVWCWGHARPDGTLDGIATCLKGHYEADDWYLGLLLLDPAARGNGLGTTITRHVITHAATDNATCLRIAVLDSNPRARSFWEGLQFHHEKSTTAGDGQLRHVHRLTFDKENNHDL